MHLPCRKAILSSPAPGTHKTKPRAEVHGSSKKLHKQKGTGGSRKVNIRNPLYKGGGTVNGPLPHGYNFKLNRKVKDLAKISALVYKARENRIVIVEDLKLESPKTKDFAAMLEVLRGDNRKTMVVLPEHDTNVYLSGRNLSGHQTIALSDMNTYDLTHTQIVIFT